MSKKLTFLLLGLTYVGGKALKSIDDTAKELARKKMESNANNNAENISGEEDFYSDTLLESEEFSVIHACTHCGAKILASCENGSVECEYCNTPYRVRNGYVLAEETVVKKKTAEQRSVRNVQNVQRSPQEPETKGLLGYLERKHIREMEALEAQRRIAEERERQLEMERQKSREEMKKALKIFLTGLLWFYGFILCFPVPVGIILKNTDSIDEEMKKKIMTVVWVVYAVFLLIVICR